MKIERHETGPRMSKAVIHGDTSISPASLPRTRMAKSTADARHPQGGIWDAAHLATLPAGRTGLGYIGGRFHSYGHHLRHGSKFAPNDLIKRPTGAAMQMKPYLDYLHEKYGALYRGQRFEPR